MVQVFRLGPTAMQSPDCSIIEIPFLGSLKTALDQAQACLTARQAGANGGFNPWIEYPMRKPSLAQDFGKSKAFECLDRVGGSRTK